MDRGHHRRPSRPDRFPHHICIQLLESDGRRPLSFSVYWAIFWHDLQRAAQAPDQSCPLAPQWPQWNLPSSASQNALAGVPIVLGAEERHPSARPQGWRSWRWQSHRSSPPPLLPPLQAPPRPLRRLHPPPPPPPPLRDYRSRQGASEIGVAVAEAWDGAAAVSGLQAALQTKLTTRAWQAAAATMRTRIRAGRPTGPGVRHRQDLGGAAAPGLGLGVSSAAAAALPQLPSPGREPRPSPWRPPSVPHPEAAGPRAACPQARGRRRGVGGCTRTRRPRFLFKVDSAGPELAPRPRSGEPAPPPGRQARGSPPSRGARGDRTAKKGQPSL